MNYQIFLQPIFLDQCCEVTMNFSNLVAIYARIYSFVTFQTFHGFLSLLVTVIDGDLRLPACVMQ
jgi:hypothetical protein